jgi:diguanylate cyclase (GGDEF)-like protein
MALVSFRRSVVRRAEADERDWIGARYDASTGLINRFGLEEAITKRIPRKSGELNVAVATVEFEGLKDIAGSYGQQTVEDLLSRLADLIDASIDKQAEIARLGPDEFALCQTGEGAGMLIRGFSRDVLEIAGEAIELGNLRLKVKASIGVAEAVVTPTAPGAPIAMSAAALQHARETGGNQIIEYDPSIDESRKKRLALQADIRRGLEAGEFDLDYQPIFDFTSQEMLGVEALMRWRRRPAGPMSPGEFIPAAESSGLIEELGLFALRRACRDILPFSELKLSVNVSTVQFRSPALTSQIDAILRSTGFPADRLQLEITESFLLEYPDRAKTAIEELRERGISIAMDDFGTGFSSVGYLRQFSFDRVKLDRSLVADIDLDPVKAAMVESTMLIAFAMGLSVTAEGVERREEASALTRLGCREFQGFLFSRPLDLDALGRLLGKVDRNAALRRAAAG